MVSQLTNWSLDFTTCKEKHSKPDFYKVPYSRLFLRVQILAYFGDSIKITKIQISKNFCIEIDNKISELI